MTTIRQLIQTSPAKANELFAKLVDTSETAIKTRERLFSELKVELDLQAELEEQHLFPVLMKHKETKGLVADALNDNKETRKLLAELERIPKDSEAFGAKVAELRKAFQQHVRDDKKEFLPAVVKALSDEEASTVVEKIEDEKAEIEAAQRADAEERRAEANREREQADAARQAADAAKKEAKADSERARKRTEAAQAGTSAAAGKTKDDKDRSETAHDAEAEREMTAPAGQTANIVEASAEMVQQGAKVARMVTRAGTDGARDIGRATRNTETASAGSSVVALLNEQTRHAMQATMAVGRARTLAEIAKVQSDFVGGSVQRMGQFNERYLALVRGGMASMSPSARR